MPSTTPFSYLLTDAENEAVQKLTREFLKSELVYSAEVGQSAENERKKEKKSKKEKKAKSDDKALVASLFK